MTRFNSGNLLLRAGASICLCVSMVGCGGGGSDSDSSVAAPANVVAAPDVTVGVEVNDLNNVLVNQRNVLSLTGAGITIVTKKCFFHNITLNPVALTAIGFGDPAILYTYTIHAADLAAAEKLGFKTDFVRSDYTKEISCTESAKGSGTLIY